MNLLGISTQVPAQAVYLSDGPSRSFIIGNRKLIFKKIVFKESGFKLCESELVVQALKALGRERIDSEIRDKLISAIPLNRWNRIVRDTRTAPAWVHNIIRKLADEVNL